MAPVVFCGGSCAPGTFEACQRMHLLLRGDTEKRIDGFRLKLNVNHVHALQLFHQISSQGRARPFAGGLKST
jgi:hypothetical protein